MEELQYLMDNCKAGVYVSINQHRDYYQSLSEYLTEEDIEDIGEDIWEEMQKRDTVVVVQFYPDSPVGFFVLHHYDLDKALKEAKRVMEGVVLSRNSKKYVKLEQEI